jgi:hypothetical protein
MRRNSCVELVDNSQVPSGKSARPPFGSKAGGRPRVAGQLHVASSFSPTTAHEAAIPYNWRNSRGSSRRRAEFQNRTKARVRVNTTVKIAKVQRWPADGARC